MVWHIYVCISIQSIGDAGALFTGVNHDGYGPPAGVGLGDAIMVICLIYLSTFIWGFKSIPINLDIL